MAATYFRKTLWLSTKFAMPALRPGSQFCRFRSSWSAPDSAVHSGNSDNSDTTRQRKIDNKPFKGKNKGSKNPEVGDKYVEEPFEDKIPSIKKSTDPDLYRIFFRSPDKIRSLEDAQVFISHIKFSYGPLTQYQFARCPETNRYLGYGFLTFKYEESLNKALSDEYIRVGMKDFELIRTGHMPSRRAILHKNIGFPGFHNLEELRAAKAKKQQEQQQQGSSGDQDTSSSSLNRTEEHPKDDTTKEAELFVSALAESVSQSDSSGSSATTTPRMGSTSRPYYKPLQKKGMAQLWKTIPNEIERSEQSPDPQNVDGASDESSNFEALNSKDVSEEVGSTMSDKLS
ncbi:hypothetical protein BC939DRAFT_500922 [Gamsiella multidivaricata]|uniref:uncharacterized protein n=1 Tax=Gamsiella multidivaricata TaxID=101098 RepID=UPI00221F65EE|nr:uncharacterized protein BC939DRAFT_500922 [Gamsiella multidivaricata]KAG0365111.1 hypothetical protein BGZ54_006849 [Gamsiella multidivaricata]KAI7827936.1 hypothetical protein BC939DRAFT_500922 [Gamsiella multidivaricata]